MHTQHVKFSAYVAGGGGVGGVVAVEEGEVSGLEDESTLVLSALVLAMDTAPGTAPVSALVLASGTGTALGTALVLALAVPVGVVFKEAAVDKGGNFEGWVNDD